MFYFSIEAHVSSFFEKAVVKNNLSGLGNPFDAAGSTT